MRAVSQGETPADWPHGLLVLLVAGPGEGPLELETRRRVFLAVNRYPGLAITRLAEQAAIDEDLVRYHVRVLEKAGLVRSEQDGVRRRIFPLEATKAGSASPLSSEERKLLGLLRKPPVLRATVALLSDGPLPAGDLAKACGVSPSTMSHHIKQMSRNELVRVEREGRTRRVHLSDRALVLRLLADHPPPRDLVQGFVEAWDELGL